MSCWKPKTDHMHLEPPDGIKELFAKAAYSENGLMSLDQFSGFLSNYQEESNPVDVQGVILRLDHRIIQQKGLHLDDFFNYLFGDHNLVLPSKDMGGQVHQDMNAPLSHYFINTRVKIRLFSPRKGQLKHGKSRRNIAAIKEALKIGGFRVIQLDLTYMPNKNSHHTGSEDIEISAILKQYMEAIKDNAFIASEYPVIIAFEGEFDSKLQSQVARMAELKFGETLHRPEEHSQEILSPENLKNKILLLQSPKEYEIEKEDHKKNKVKSYSKRAISGNGGNMKLDEVENEKYKSLITINDVKLKGNINETLSTKHDKICCFRLTQPKLESIMKSHAVQIVEFAQRNLLMVYPVDKLSGSSNCNPLVGWSHGAQMVAVNIQGHDKYLEVMQGMFRANGGCGFVKKPDILLKSNENIFDPKTTLRVKSTLKVKIYMGDGWHLDFSAIKFDVFSPPDFFLKVQIFGVTSDIAKEETHLQEDKWRPEWNQEFEFPLTVPELAFLRIEARDFDDDRSHAFGGQTCLPVWELKRGIRTVPLYDKRGVMYKHIRLLVQFKLV